MEFEFKKFDWLLICVTGPLYDLADLNIYWSKPCRFEYFPSEWAEYWSQTPIFSGHQPKVSLWLSSCGKNPAPLLDLSLCQETLGLLSPDVASLMGRRYPMATRLRSFDTNPSVWFQKPNIKSSLSDILYTQSNHYILYLV